MPPSPHQYPEHPSQNADRVVATYMSRRSSARSRVAQASAKASSEVGSRPRSSGRSPASPRRLNGISRALSVHRVEIRGRAGNTWDRSPSARPGTNTAGHCRPLAACTVSSLTESDSPTRPVSSPNSSCWAAVR